MTPRIIFLLLAGLLLSLCISPQKPESKEISLEELLPQEAELPPVWNISWSGKVNSGKAVASLVYLPKGGRAWLWIYRDGNRSVFSKEMGWGKAKGSLIKRLTYNGVYIYRYRTWMGYDRYLAHTGGYTFVFDSGEYATDDYSVSGAPQDDADELFRLVLSHALEKGVRAEEVKPEARKTNLTFSVKAVEMPHVSIEFGELRREVTPDGILVSGVLRLKNTGGRTLRNVQLQLVAGELNPNEMNALRHIPELREEPHPIRDAVISPASLSIRRLAPGEVEEFPVKITLRGGGNLYKLEALYRNHSIWSTFGFISLSTRSFVYSELWHMLKNGSDSIAVVYGGKTLKKTFMPGDKGYNELVTELVRIISKLNLQAKCAFSEERIDEIRRGSYAVELILREPGNFTVAEWVKPEDRDVIRTDERGYRVLLVRDALFVLDGEYRNKVFLSSGAGDWTCWAVSDYDWTPEVDRLVERFAKKKISDRRISLKDAVWNGEYWLIAGSTGERGLLVRYDGGKFTDLSEEAGFSAPSPTGGRRMGSVDALAWNGSVWLIAGGGYCKGGGLLKSYDGGRFVNLTPPPETYSSKEEFIHALRNISGIHCVAALAWNGSEWLLSSLFPGGRVIEYNGSAFNEAVELSHVEHIAWGDGYWLLVSGGFYSRLVKYDGERLEDVTPEENISISAIAWNGSEWLIAGAELGEPDYEGRRRIEETFALRYNGSAFAKVVIPGNAYISSIAWTGRRWLLAGSALLSYDGSELEEIPLPEGVSYAKVRWGGDYGLVVARSGEGTRLFRYDGSTFKDLTGALYSELGAVP